MKISSAAVSNSDLLFEGEEHDSSITGGRNNTYGREEVFVTSWEYDSYYLLEEEHYCDLRKGGSIYGTDRRIE